MINGIPALGSAACAAQAIVIMHLDKLDHTDRYLLARDKTDNRRMGIWEDMVLAEGQPCISAGVRWATVYRGDESVCAGTVLTAMAAERRGQSCAMIQRRPAIRPVTQANQPDTGMSEQRASRKPAQPMVPSFPAAATMNGEFSGRGKQIGRRS